MRTLKVLISAGLIFCSLGATSVSAATLLTAVYMGSITSISDPSQIFGGAFDGANVGDAVTSRFVFDLSKGVDGATSPEDDRAGGTSTGASNPIISETLTIGSTTISVPHDYFGFVFTRGAATQGAVEAESQQLVGSTDVILDSFIEVLRPGVFPATLGPVQYNVMPGDAEALIDLYAGSPSGPHLDASAASVLITVSAVPEPTTWALFILGFGGIGAMLRRQRALDGAKVAAA